MNDVTIQTVIDNAMASLTAELHKVVRLTTEATITSIMADLVENAVEEKLDEMLDSALTEKAQELIDDALNEYPSSSDIEDAIEFTRDFDPRDFVTHDDFDPEDYVRRSRLNDAVDDRLEMLGGSDILTRDTLKETVKPLLDDYVAQNNLIDVDDCDERITNATTELDVELRQSFDDNVEEIVERFFADERERLMDAVREQSLKSAPPVSSPDVVAALNQMANAMAALRAALTKENDDAMGRCINRPGA